MLMAKGGEELPLDSWAAEFRAQLPQEILDAQRNADMGADNVDLRVRLGKVLARLKLQFRESLLGSHPAGTQVGGVAGETKVRRRRRTPPPPQEPGPPHSHVGGKVSLLRKKTGHTPGIRRRDDEVPQVRWCTSAQWAEHGFGPKFAADFNPNGPDGTGLLLVNEYFPAFQQAFSYWGAQYSHVAGDTIINLVKDCYSMELTTKVAHALWLNGKSCADGSKFGPDDVTKMTTPQALTLGVLGMINVEMQIQTRAGGLFGKAASAA
jgi:hypothetical protein